MNVVRKKLFRLGAAVLCGVLHSGAAAAQSLEDVFWDSVKGCTSAGDVEVYLEEFPKGRYVEAARACLAQLQGFSGPPGTGFRDCPACPEMVVVPAGSFIAGSPAGEKGRLSWEDLPRRVSIPKPFAIGKYEITRGEYARFVQETGHRPKRYSECITLGGDVWGARYRGWRDPGFWQDDRHPVVCVGRADIEAYLRWLSELTGKNYRLPLEVEWEYAARAGSTSSRYWGDSTKVQCDYANGADIELKDQIGVSIWPLSACRDGSPYTSRVGKYRANGFGLHDVLGNVWELAGNSLKGGSWSDDPGHLRAAVRLKAGDGLIRSSDVGFRVVSGAD